MKEQKTIESVSIIEAARILGISTRTCSQWVNDSTIKSRLEKGKRLINVSDIETLKQKSVAKTVKKTTARLAILRHVNGYPVPDGFDVIAEYNELSEYTVAFANGKIGFLLLVGSPGSGKSKQMQSDLEDKCTWIDNHATNLGLYCSVYESNNVPVVLDDVNHFLENKKACSLIKALTQTEDIRSVSWESPVKYLVERGVPRKFTTSSPICLIANLWDVADADYAAIQDRSLPVAFCPSAETIHLLAAV